MVVRRQMSRNAHRVGFGRVNQRMRRTMMVTPPPAPIGHNAMPDSDSQSDWLKERPMSDDWNNNHNNEWHQNNQYQPHQDQQQHNPYQGGPYQGEQTFQLQPEFQQQTEFQQHSDAQPEHQPAASAPSAELVRLDAVEAAIQDLRARIDEMKASQHAQATAPAPEPVHVEAPAAVDTHADRLASIEAEIGNVKALVTTLSQNLADIHADVKSNAALHDETRGIVDEQHQLMRGLNYIITSAIGTLTTSAKTVK